MIGNENSKPAQAERTTIPAAAGPTTASKPFVVAIEASVSGGTRPIVTGKTNLPDGTHLSIFLRRDDANLSDAALSACREICSGVWASPLGGVVVKNGQFSDGPFTDKKWPDKGAELIPDTYVLVVQLWASAAAGQPPNVLAILGPLGENMTGPLVGACCFAPGRRADPAQIQETKNLLKTTTNGAQAEYARYVTIGIN
jgi:hypothetical protein